MKHEKLEILRCIEGTSDKVYIVEWLEDGGNHYVYANYGKRTLKNLIKQLKYSGDSFWEAEEEFDKVVREKTRKGYDPIPQGTAIDIPGFPAILAAAKGRKTLQAPQQAAVPVEKAGVKRLLPV